MQIHKLSGALALTLCLSFAVARTAFAIAANDRPNIVLIMADDLGYGELGCYGQKIIQTPSIDKLANSGIRFTDFYSGFPVCAPSRCVLMTGKHAGHAAIRDNKGVPNLLPELRQKYGWDTPGQQPLPAKEVTIAELLKSRGYATAAIGKWGLGFCGTTGDPNLHGFDLFYGYLCQNHAHNHYPTYLWRNDKKELLPGNNNSATGQTHSQDMFTKEAVKFIDNHKDGPFFLYLPFTIPHLSIQVPEASLAQYQDKVTETDYVYKAKAYYQHATPHAAYAAMISHMDAAVGTVVAELKKHGLTDNTIVIFTSDNGPAWKRLGGTDSAFFHSTGPLRGHKGEAYEGGIREPFIACWPEKISAGRKSDYIGGLQDVLPTLCDLAGVEKPANIDGISILPTLLGQGEQRQHKYLYWEFPGYDQQQAVREGKWKIIRSGVDRGDPPFELYDLSADIGEKRNIADKHPDVVARIAKYAIEAHTPSKLFPLLPTERPKGYVPVGGDKFRE